MLKGSNNHSMQISGEYLCRVFKTLATPNLHGALIENDNFCAQFPETNLKGYTGAGAAFKEKHTPSLAGKGLRVVQAVFLVIGCKIKNLKPL
jgi:hypothetical protein